MVNVKNDKYREQLLACCSQLNSAGWADNKIGIKRENLDVTKMVENFFVLIRHITNQPWLKSHIFFMNFWLHLESLKLQSSKPTNSNIYGSTLHCCLFKGYINNCVRSPQTNHPGCVPLNTRWNADLRLYSQPGSPLGGVYYSCSFRVSSHYVSHRSLKHHSHHLPLNVVKD